MQGFMQPSVAAQTHSGIFLHSRTEECVVPPRALTGSDPVCYTEKETNLRSFILRDLLPSSVDSYYRYTGSLTTPPCSKVVEWIIFSRPVYLSHSQVRLVNTHTRARSQTAIFFTHSQIPFAHSQWITRCPTVSAHKQFFSLILSFFFSLPSLLPNSSAYETITAYIEDE